MPTCASKIMLTSLAPSPTARVMGCSLEALISFTICRKTQRKIKLFVPQNCVLFLKRSAALSPEPSAAAPCDSTARRCSCGRSPEKCLCSCRDRPSPGWASVLQTEWPRRWSDRNPGSRPTTCNKIPVISAELFKQAARHESEYCMFSSGFYFKGPISYPSLDLYFSSPKARGTALRD